MQVEKATEMGACPGVKRALAIAEKAAREKGRVQTLGPLVHNRQTVAHLAQLGVETIANLEHLHHEAVIIPAHGAPPRVWEEVQKRGREIIDATCPIVHDAQQMAHGLGERGFQVIIFGNAEHPEVQGLLGWAGKQARATMDAGSVILEQPHRLGILSQTTQSQVDFTRFVSHIVDQFLPRLLELRVMNTICDATRKRQEAAVALAKRVDLILVIGGPDSANTRRLAETCAATGVATHFIEKAQDILPEWLKNQPRIGITAGTSTPDQTIAEVMAGLQKYHGTSL